MSQTSLPIKSWFKKGLSLVLILTILSSGFIILKSTSTRGWFHFTNLNFWALGLACLALLSSWFIEVLRLRLIAASLGEKISFTKMLGINLATNFSNNITPFNTGGVPTQIYLFCQNGMQPGKASAIVTIRVITSTLLFTLFSPILLIFYYTKFPFGLLHKVTTVAIPISCILSIGLIAFIIKPKLAQHLFTFFLKRFKFGQKIQPLLEKLLREFEIFHESIKIIRKNFSFYFVFVYTFLYWATFFSIAPLLMYAFGINATEFFFTSILFQFVLVFIVAYLPFPGGSGLMELGFFSVFKFIPPPVLAIFILVWRFISYHLSNLIGGIVLLRIINRSSQQVAATQD